MALPLRRQIILFNLAVVLPVLAIVAWAARETYEEQIQQLREEPGESRMQLADSLQVTLDEVSDWELGRDVPGLSSIRSLAEHFDVPEYDLELYPPREQTHAQ